MKYSLKSFGGKIFHLNIQCQCIFPQHCILDTCSKSCELILHQKNACGRVKVPSAKTTITQVVLTFSFVVLFLG